MNPSNRPTRRKSERFEHKYLDKSSLCSTSYHSIITDSPSTFTYDNDILFFSIVSNIFVNKFKEEPPIQHNNNLPPTIQSSLDALKYKYLKIY
ncbi:hypothetical protein PPL_05055 [Heterostelium album PN500]|uniref:Uncharacterized protein n=1 Tax=Heterostelium pallidum (strain ATCC 26659 / Pp 5 / PN500) TaxID=670386 RepID=D3B9B1_HETP5|nr:hypothetical protein PPL_05055 [Heterostelium album PN500]EFA81823.1 hypothetical protein PPL_05055 [Heterostelium album PN500]|eukprot:XP_020433940.1 hypothetical protein PPL_05055 [Heterostelium album PN500]